VQRYISLFLLGLSILGSAGCASTPKLYPVADAHQAWKQMKPRLIQLKTWEIEGRIGIETPQQSLSADALWTQQQSHYQMIFSGALGLGTIRLANQAGKVVLINAKGQRFVADNASVLMQQQLGWYVPVVGLYYWVRGLPIPGVASQRYLNQYGTLKILNQQGWHIMYALYSEQHGCILPSRLMMMRDNLSVVLLINHWFA